MPLLREGRRVMFCARCDKPLREADAAPVDVHRPTGAGSTVYIHRGGCQAPPHQTSPVSRPEPIREG